VPNPWIDIDFNSYLEMLWNRDDVVHAHEKELQGIIDYCELNDIALFVIVFPDLADLENLKFVSDHVLNYFNQRDIPTMDVYNLVKCHGQADRVVNFQDSHPSVKTHKIVGIELAELIGNDNREIP